MSFPQDHTPLLVGDEGKQTREGRRKRVVVLGGGFAGRRAARLLRANSRELEVIVIDAKGYFEYTPGALRCLVEAKHCSSILLPHPAGLVIADTATCIHARTSCGRKEDGEAEGEEEEAYEVLLGSGKRVSCDYVVVSTGSSYRSPIKPGSTLQTPLAARREQIEGSGRHLESASSVVVVGGGFVGVELAAEIVGKYGKRKNVSLVVGGERLLQRMAPKVGRYAEQWLEAKGCNIVRGERIMADFSTLTEYSPGRTIQTDQGTTILADVVFVCAGFGCNNDVIRASKPEAIDASGGIVVSDNLKVAGYSNVFAVGDCTKWDEEKNAMNADISATLACKNVLRSVRGEKRLLHYPADVCYGRQSVPFVAILSLYKYSAAMQFNWLVITGPIAAGMKYMIEFMQIQTAKENALIVFLWQLMEEVTLLTGRYLIK